MILFKIMWGVDAVASLIILYFFVAGLGDNTVSSRNMGLWMTMLGTIAVVMLGSIWLRARHHNIPANLLLLIIFIPALLFLGYMLIVLLNKGKWN
jgi:apolipoprotein N-acyltransferase